jgi:predicted nucleic acid-binding protein
VTTWPVITEACHFLNQAGKRALLTFLRRGALRLEALSVEDMPALDDLLARHARMDFADATLVLIAEKTGITEIFTIDRRDFEAYRTPSGRRFKLLLA